MARADREKKNLDFQIAFYEGVLKEDPNLVDVLIPLGDAYTKRGLYEKGLEVDLRLSRLRPEDATVLYNVACSYSLLKQMDSALEALEKALSLGYNEFKFLMSDPDLENLRKDPRFNPLMEKYRKKKQKPSS
jgi:tetratricopeptide (TPR) repeat protein